MASRRAIEGAQASAEPSAPATLRSDRPTLHETAELDADVVSALSGIAAGDPYALQALYSLMSAPMYSLLLGVTHDLEAADDALVASFARMWRTRAHRPAGAGAAWVMDLACVTARAPLAPAG